MITIDKNTCTRDGRCIVSCPAALITSADNGIPQAIPAADELCIRCGHCVAVCPSASINHRDIPRANSPAISPDLGISLAQGEQFLRSRRSIRVYEKRPVSRDVIEKLIRLARFAPSGHNCQPVEWLVLTDQEELRRLAGHVAAWMAALIKKAGDYARMLHLDRTLAGWNSGRDVFLRDAPVLIIAHAPRENPLAPKAAVIALTYMELSAPLVGLGTCWAGYLTAAAGSFAPLREAMLLPEKHECLGALMAGYPRLAYHRLPPRREPRITWRPEK